MDTKWIRFIVLLTLTGCIGSSKFQKTEGETWKPRYQVLAGVNNGGVIENTDFGETPDVQVMHLVVLQKRVEILGLTFNCVRKSASKRASIICIMVKPYLQRSRAWI
jgi:hypothetical protein